MREGGGGGGGLCTIIRPSIRWAWGREGGRGTHAIAKGERDEQRKEEEKERKGLHIERKRERNGGWLLEREELNSFLKILSANYC